MIKIIIINFFSEKIVFFKCLPGSDRPHVRTCSGKSWIVLGDATSSTRFLVPETRTKALVTTTIRNNKDVP